MTTDMITLSFTPTKEDYTQTVRVYLWRMGHLRLMLFAFGIIFTFGVVLLLVSDKYTALASLLMLQLPLFCLYFWFLTPILLARRVQRNERLSSQIFWTVDAERMVIRNRFAESSIEWESLKEVSETANHYLLVGKTFLFIPKRAFPSPAEEAAFRDLVRRLVTKHRLDPTYDLPGE